VIVQRRYPPGAPCLSAVRSTDVEAAVGFYGRLFGWTPVPAAANGFVIMMLGDLPVAGIGPVFQPSDDVRWCTYVATPDADLAAAAVTAAGGMVRVEPFDVPGIARVGIAADPGGAEFWIWQPYAFVGAEVTGVPGATCGRVLTTSDPDRARTFYRTVFGWTGTECDFRLDGQVVGEIDVVRGDGAPAWTPIVAVADLERASEVAQGLDATVGPVLDAARGRLIRDPNGAELLIRRPPPPSAVLPPGA